MKFNKKTIIGLPGLSPEQRAQVAALDLAENFTASKFLFVYQVDGAAVPDIVRAYGAMVASKLIPETGAMWKIARLAFLVQPEASGLREWAEKLGPENWGEARRAAFATNEAARQAAARHAAAAREADSATEAAASLAARQAPAHQSASALEAALAASYAANYTAALAASGSKRTVAAYAQITALRAIYAAADCASDQERRILEVIFEAAQEPIS